jgi:FkbM family methyltransferase
MVSFLSLLSKINHYRLDARNARKLNDRKKRLKSFGEFASGLFVDTPQGMYIINPADTFVAKSLLQTGGYGRHEIELISRFVGPQSTCFVLGGHIGSIAIPMSKMVDRVYVFEANPETFKYLKGNVALNECKNIDLYNYAVSDVVGEIAFILQEANSGSSRRKPIHAFEPVSYEVGKEISVPTKVLDDMFPDVSPDLIFMDIEGSEYFALKGAQSLLSRTKALIMEFDAGYFKKVSGKTPLEIWEVFAPHFTKILQPKKNLLIEGSDAVKAEVLRIINDNESHENIVFMK